MKQNRFLVGLTGSIGTGKSYAGTFFKEKGCYVIDADQIAKSLYKKGSPILAELSLRFGSVILDGEGELLKEVLGKIVFSDRSALEDLNEIVKTYLKTECDRILDALSPEESRPFVVLEAPVLFEYGFESYVDYILLITCREDLIIERVMKRNGVSAEEVLARLRSQVPQEEKLRRSNLALDNSSSREDFKEHLESAYLQILEKVGER